MVGLLGWSLTRHLRRADDNRRAGVFGDAPEQPDDEAPSAVALADRARDRRRRGRRADGEQPR